MEQIIQLLKDQIKAKEDHIVSLNETIRELRRSGELEVKIKQLRPWSDYWKSTKEKGLIEFILKKLNIIFFYLLISSCTGVIPKSDVFIGEWIMSDQTPNYSICPEETRKKLKMKISLDGIFYKVDYLIDGKSLYDITEVKGNIEQEAIKSIKQYQLSDDKRMLINIISIEHNLKYNESNNTITTEYGWFKRK